MSLFLRKMTIEEAASVPHVEQKFEPDATSSIAEKQV